MIYDIALTIALILFAIGLIHKIDTWFIVNVGIGERTTSMAQRFKSGVKGVLGSIFSRKLFTLLRVLIVDVLFQVRILKDKQDPLAWIMHICIFFGFMFLLLFHALSSLVTVSLDPEFQSTLNPYMFLRNLFGCILAIGLILAVIRRAVTMKGRMITTGSDIFVLVLLAVIVASGFLLEGLKITSQDSFDSMVEDYAIDPDPEELQALTAYWVEHYGLVSKNVQGPFEADLLTAGEELNAASCMECHVRPQAAFISYPLSRLLKPMATGLDQAGFKTLVWYVHILASFLGLAYLAFGKMFHVIGTPLSLLVAELTGPSAQPETVATRQVLELDGCSHGGICHEECPVRQRRMERIDQFVPFTPMMVFLDEKTTDDMGSRPISNN